MAPLKKGNPVVYRPRYLDFNVLGMIRRVHRDGTVTVEARHVLDEAGNPEGGYLGYSYRIPSDSIQRGS